jgi:P-type E1-E2 ATPase
MSAAYKKGVIVKTGGVLEMLAKAKFFVFDKTGTITLGTPKVSQIIPSEGVTQNEVLTIATSLEQFSTHVLGKAIMKFSHDQGNTVFFMPANFHEDFGLGVSGEVNGKKYFLGKKYYLESMGLEFPRMLNAASEAALQKGQITIYLSDAKKVIGLILFEDELRPDSKSIFSRFVLDGRVSLSILTGDSEAKAKQVGELLGVADVIAETNPQGKMEFVKEKQREGVVVMVGDGVNDAPALSQADVGVAITNQDRTASSQVADVVVVSNSITSIYDVYNISKKTTYLAKQGIFIGMTASVVAMIFAGFGFIAPLHGALLQEAIDIVVILNALRLKVYFDIVKLR